MEQKAPCRFAASALAEILEAKGETSAALEQYQHLQELAEASEIAISTDI